MPTSDSLTAPPPLSSLGLLREDFDIGRAIFGNALACCRHSQVLDCAEDSERTRAAGGKAVGQRVFVARDGDGGSCGSDGEDVENCAVCGGDEIDPKRNALLLCDGTDKAVGPCSKTYHQACLQPPLAAVPDGDWFCPDCARARAAPPADVEDKGVAHE